MLPGLGIGGADINGYETEEFTHGAVAAFVASGMADVGLGVETAARQFKLDFLPIVTERYYLTCKPESLDLPAVSALRRLLVSDKYRKAIDGLPGYSAEGSGEVASFQRLFPETFS